VDYRASQFDPARATREHVVPRSLGGLNQPRNIEVACMACNSSRGSRTDWIAYDSITTRGVVLAPSQRFHLETMGRLPVAALSRAS